MHNDNNAYILSCMIPSFYKRALRRGNVVGTAEWESEIEDWYWNFVCLKRSIWDSFVKGGRQELMSDLLPLLKWLLWGLIENIDFA